MDLFRILDTVQSVGILYTCRIPGGLTLPKPAPWATPSF